MGVAKIDIRSATHLMIWPKIARDREIEFISLTLVERKL